MNEGLIAIILGLTVGFVNRILMLRTDYRQYPTHKHGKMIHLSLGFIAASLGALAIPALMKENYTAITFLTLAAQQFRDVRNMERETLSKLDQLELVPRGITYIEGIAMVFEGRNYLVIFAAFFVSLATTILDWKYGIIVGLLVLYISKKVMSGKRLKNIANVKKGEVIIEGPHLYVDDIYIMNIGLKTSQELIKNHGLGIIVQPKSQDSVVTIANLGQRQAILHNLSTILGVYRDSGEPSLIPLTKRDLNDGRIGVFFLPQIKSLEKAIEVVEYVPVLENAIRIPTESKQNEEGE